MRNILPGAFPHARETSLRLHGTGVEKTVELAFDTDEAVFLRRLTEPVELRSARLSGRPMAVKFSDRELAERLPAICRNEWNVQDYKLLGAKELLRLCQMMYRRFGATPDQLQRLLGVDKSRLEDWL